MRGGWVYVMTNRPFGTSYVGVTDNIARQAWEHRRGAGSAFTARYRLVRLVYMEHHDAIETAIQRETRIKHWPRSWKVALIASTNPEWEDLFGSLNM
jgi:putative endonuclease